MIKHTPGPWDYDGKFTVTIPHKEGTTAFRTNPEDARLIAVSPKLLELVKTLVLITANAFDPKDFASIGNEAIKTIAKAEGDEK